MYIISPFTPLFFHPSTDTFQSPSSNVQVWSPEDQILVQVISYDTRDNVPDAVLNSYDERMVKTESTLVWNTWRMNTDVTIFWTVITALTNGLYSVTIDEESELFKVTDDEAELSKTTLLQYSSSSNRERKDVCFWIDMQQYFFSFRVPGGFKDNGWQFGVDNEQFTDMDYDVTDVCAHEQLVKVFTLGNSIGVPPWYAHLLNMALCCTYVYLDGVRYVRSESNVPEMTESVETLKSFIYKQSLVKVTWLDPEIEQQNQLSIRRVYLDSGETPEDEVYRETSVDNEDYLIRHRT